MTWAGLGFLVVGLIVGAYVASLRGRIEVVVAQLTKQVDDALAAVGEDGEELRKRMLANEQVLGALVSDPALKCEHGVLRGACMVCPAPDGSA